MKFTLLLVVTIVLLLKGCKGENRTAVDPIPIFDGTPILKIVPVVQSTFFGALQNIDNLIHNSSEAIVNNLKSVRKAYFDTVGSQSSLAIRNLVKDLNSAQALISKSLQAAVRRTLGITRNAPRVANCLSNYLTDTIDTIQDVANFGFDCVHAEFNEGVNLFDILVQYTTGQGTKILDLPKQIEICNKYQSGSSDSEGFMKKSNCLNSLPDKVTADGIQYFAMVPKLVRDTSELVAPIPQEIADCARNATNRIQQTAQNIVSKVENCTKTKSMKHSL